MSLFLLIENSEKPLRWQFYYFQSSRLLSVEFVFTASTVSKIVPLSADL